VICAIKINYRDPPFVLANRAVLAAYTVAGRTQLTAFVATNDEFGPGHGNFPTLILSPDHYKFDFHCRT
jgi:hypothetical protein